MRGGASVFVLAAIFCSASAAQDDARLERIARLGPPHDVPEGGYLGLAQAVRDARNDRVIAVVASHPDDQYLLPGAFLRLNAGYRVTAVLATRGEGGQNRTGPQTGEELGVLRTLETADAARRLGLLVEHVNLPDAGFSRTGEEALELWGRAAATEAVARAFRRVRPDVVLTTHHPAETHGHDLALLAILPDAVALAGDPDFVTPGLEPVVIDRLYRGAAPDEEPLFVLPTDDVDPDRGETYRTIAYQALTQAHRSQAPFRPADDFFAGSNRFAGVPLPNADAPPPAELHDGLPDAFSLLSIPNPLRRELRTRIDAGLPALTGNRPRLAATALRLRENLRVLLADAAPAAVVRLERRIEALERVALHALGFRAAVQTDRPVAVPGEPLSVRVEVSSSGLVPVRSLELDPIAPGAPVPELLEAPNLMRPQPWVLRARLAVPDDALQLDPLRDLFRHDSFALPLRVAVRIEVPLEGGATTLRVPLDIPVPVRPRVELAVQPDILLIPDGDVSVRFNVRVRRNTAAPVEEVLRVQVPPGFDVEPHEVPLDLRTVPEQGHLFRLTVPAGLRPGPQAIRVRLGAASERLELHRVSVVVPRDLRVGLIRGVDDAVHTVLSQLGCELVELTSDTLPTRPLDDLDTVVVDVRALNGPDGDAARAEFNRLLAFAAAGGRLVVLYHKDAEIDFELVGQRFHPRGMPLRIGKGRTTREDAPVEVLAPEHPLLRSPNRLQPDDWDGWTQERGLYFASEWSDDYQPILRMGDPGQPPEDGALLHARVGSGEFVYCALALHRQLQSLHPGACRLLANLVSHRRP